MELSTRGVPTMRQQIWVIQQILILFKMLTGELSVNTKQGLQTFLQLIAFGMGLVMILYPFWFFTAKLSHGVLIISPQLILTAIGGVVGIGLSRPNPTEGR
jgi:hypothetical protein